MGLSLGSSQTAVCPVLLPSDRPELRGVPDDCPLVAFPLLGGGGGTTDWAEFERLSSRIGCYAIARCSPKEPCAHSLKSHCWPP